MGNYCKYGHYEEGSDGVCINEDTLPGGCAVHGCMLDYRAHAREYDRIERVVGPVAASEYEQKHLPRCDNCGEPIDTNDEKAEVVGPGMEGCPVSDHLLVHAECMTEGQVMA